MYMNVGASRLLEAFHAMAPEAAALILNAAQMYAERHPRPLRNDGEQDDAQSFEAVQEVGEQSPIGVCIVRWNDLRYTYVNAAYKAYFSELGRTNLPVIGRKISEVVPQFVERGIMDIFSRVAETGAAFSAKRFHVDVDNNGETYWDWSVSRLPTAAGDDVCLLVQANRVYKPSLRAII